MLQVLEMSDGFATVLFTSVGTYYMKGSNVSGAVAQFSAYAKGNVHCGYALDAMLCSDTEHSHLLKNPKQRYDITKYERNTAEEEFRTLDVLRRDKNSDPVVPRPIKQAFQLLEKGTTDQKKRKTVSALDIEKHTQEDLPALLVKTSTNSSSTLS